MSQNVELSPEEQNALDQLSRELQGTDRTRGVPDIGQLCEQYNRLKPTLEIVVRIVERIPVYGSKAAQAIRFLMGLADMACPIQ
ncbi:MAG TPA: hypothetical protein VNA19_16475 [Pyrinomonadaceae bacterium]|jgi:hypothetical protein|nr:hypothetical protein [Pyrinomonadaceae bacterium]